MCPNNACSRLYCKSTSASTSQQVPTRKPKYNSLAFLYWKRIRNASNSTSLIYSATNFCSLGSVRCCLAVLPARHSRFKLISEWAWWVQCLSKAYAGVCRNTVEVLVRDHLGNSETWSQPELVAYENGLSYVTNCDKTEDDGRLQAL